MTKGLTDNLLCFLPAFNCKIETTNASKAIKVAMTEI